MDGAQDDIISTRSSLWEDCNPNRFETILNGNPEGIAYAL